MKDSHRRVEVVANISLEFDFFERLVSLLPEISYTKIPVVHGRGNKGERSGDSVWPEENFLFFSYCSPAQAKLIETIVEDLKKEFPEEGINFFQVAAL